MVILKHDIIAISCSGGGEHRSPRDHDKEKKQDNQKNNPRNTQK